MKFESAVGWWYYLIIILVAGSLWFSFVPQIKTGQASPVFAVLVILLALGLPLWLLFSTFYRVENGILHIRSGPASWKIKVSEIHSAEPSHSLWSSPALSLNRIKLIYGQGKHILVSPKDHQAFLKAIGHAGQA